VNTLRHGSKDVKASWLAIIVSSLSCLLPSVSGCGQRAPADELPVYPVLGTVLVDGEPVAGIQVAFHHVARGDSEHVTYPQGFTNDQGQIEISTYASGDGAPAGEYRVTFVQKPFDAISHSFSGKDKLEGRYGDPDESGILINVGPDKGNDLGTIDLSSDPKEQ